MGVSKNNGTPKSSILIGLSIINHPFGGTPIFGNTHIFSNLGFLIKYLYVYISAQSCSRQSLEIGDSFLELGVFLLKVPAVLFRGATLQYIYI